MGTIADTAIAVVDHLRGHGRRVGCIAVTRFRPFPAEALRAAIGNARAVAVIERTDEPAAARQPADPRGQGGALRSRRRRRRMIPRVLSVSAGLGSRDVRPETWRRSSTGWPTTARPPSAATRSSGSVTRWPSSARPLDLRPPGAYSLRGHSIGGFGSVTTNKLVATLVGDLFGLYVQAYPRYGSEKKGLPTTYYLTIADGADPPAGGARAGRLRAAPRRGGVPPGRSAARPGRRRHGLRPVAADGSRRRSGRRSRRRPTDDRSTGASARRPRHRGPGPQRTPRGRTSSCACRASRSSACSCG